MTKSQPIPDAPDTFTDEDFRTARSRVKAARSQALTRPGTARAHRALGEQLAARFDGKQATLAQVRRAVGLTQMQLAETLGMDQGDISRLERRQNFHLATLARFIEATGGRLRIVAVYDDQEVPLAVGDVAPVDERDAAEV
ncbi:MAG: helix-turn-helix domain-containing protein [Acidimicrobiales bacterium]